MNKAHSCCVECCHNLCTLLVQYLCPALPSGANITVVQDPEPVAVGQNVTLTCNATAVQKIKALNWTVDDKLLHPADKGVVDLLQPALGELSVSSVLTLSVKSENGDQWPETVQCMVVLELEQNVSETYNVTVKATGKSLVHEPCRQRSLLLIQV